MNYFSAKLALAFAVVAGISGCATPLPEMNADFLCQHFGNNNQSKTDRVSSIRAEIQRRKLLTTDELAAADQGTLQIGMSRCGMFAVQGGQLSENTTTTAAGSFVQHIFFNSVRGKREYVYTQNGRVTSWQK
jgi:hypothetical protein